MDGPCCNKKTCNPYTAAELLAKPIVCSNGTDCKEEIFCKAGTFECPVDDAEYWKKDDQGGTNPWCNKKTELCYEGYCNMSICSITTDNHKTSSCQCSEDENKCKLCCPKVVDGKTECFVASNETLFPDLKGI